MTTTVPPPVFAPGSGGEGGDRNGHEVDAKLDAKLVEADLAFGGRDSKRGFALLAEALAACRDVEEARAVLNRAFQAALSLPTDAEAGVALFVRAEERFGVRRDVLEGRAQLHELAGHAQAAMATLQRIIALSDDDAHKALLWERIGDLARGPLSQPQQALIHYQSAFRLDRKNRRAVRKATTIYFEQNREEQAKQLLDLELEQLGDGVDKEEKLTLAELYVKVGESLLVRPASHAIAKDAVDRAAKLVPDLPRVRTLKAELENFPQAWKDHVRRLRDQALDARDKREAARRYLAIAQIHATYAQNDPQIEQNIEKCLLLAPGYRPALKFLEKKYRDEGKLAEFIERLKKQAEAVRAVDAAVDLWLFVAVLLAERGATPDEVAGAYEKVRRIDPRNVAAIHALTELFLEHGQYERAVVVMEAFLAEASDVEARRQTLRQLARIYEVEIKDLHKAAERLEQMRGLGDDGDDSIVHLADLYERLGESTKLAEVLEARARQRHLPPADEAATLERLVALYQGALAAPDKAFQAGRRLFVLAPREAMEVELLRLADALQRGADLAQSFVDAAGRSTAPADARRLRLKAADLFTRGGDKRRARQVLDELIAKDPHDKEVVALLDAMLAKDASPDELVVVLEARLQTQADPLERAQTLLMLADAYGRMRKIDDAVRHLQAVLDTDTGSATRRSALEKLEGLLRGQERFADLGGVLMQRVEFEEDSGSGTEAVAATTRLARLYEEKLDRADDGAQLLLQAFERQGDGAVDPDVVKSLERLQGRGVRIVEIACALQPLYARTEN